MPAEKTKAADKFLTVGDIARQLNVPLHRVRYLVESRGIEDAGTVGNLRIYDKGVLELVRGYLAELVKGRPREIRL